MEPVWGVVTDTGYYFSNTIPVVSTSASSSGIKNFLTGTSGNSLPEASTPITLSTTVESIVNRDSFLTKNRVYYLTNRNTPDSDHGNGFNLGGNQRSHIGLIWAAPQNSGNKTYLLHMQFMATWPGNLRIPYENTYKSCNLTFYMRTTY